MVDFIPVRVRFIAVPLKYPSVYLDLEFVLKSIDSGKLSKQTPLQNGRKQDAKY